MLTEQQIDDCYSWRCGDWYEKTTEQDGWVKCKDCGVLPRTWIFNNGCFAKCLCFEMYDEQPARCESILSVVNRTGLTAEYKQDNLRLAWNTFAETGVPQNILDNGRW